MGVQSEGELDKQNTLAKSIQATCPLLMPILFDKGGHSGITIEIKQTTVSSFNLHSFIIHSG